MELMQFQRLYKSPIMRELLESIKKLSFDSTVFFIYGEKGTEKDYILKLILANIHEPDIIKIPEDMSKKSLIKHENIVYLIKNPENIDTSFVFNPEKSFKCAIFLSDCDYVQLYKNGLITFELYENLLNSRKFYIPPLRERKQDIIPLANFFLQEISECLNLPKKELSKDAQEAILEHSWTENAYQLKQCLAKACILSRHQRLTSKDLFGQYDDQLSIKNFLELKIGNLLKDFANIENSNLYETVIQEVEKALFILAINETGGNQVKAAKILGINRNTLNKKLKHYNLI
ncbi:helix-turn-helix domain-containing protein [Thermodesulfovibrio sp. 3907-1M]|uniref:Helix-turn-helix domain-containing protein n=1 Tax=Thermodesulfovibrio autotrophicus TaxID=3118333 RepID=A0AAU8H1H1_9BACT